MPYNNQRKQNAVANVWMEHSQRVFFCSPAFRIIMIVEILVF